MSKNQAKALAALSLVIFALAFLISGRLWFRVDMTGNNIFTISQVSQNLHREISDQVRITYFVSDRLVLAHPMPTAVADLLREYAAHSRGRIRVTQRDPVRADLVRSVEELGIIPWQIQVIEHNEPVAVTVYSGILIEYLDRAAVIPVVFSLYTLEYDLSSRIRALARNTPREIGVIVASAHQTWHTDFSLLNRALFMAGFTVRLISPWEDIPGTLPALFVFGGAEDLHAPQLYRIDRYITGGGNVLFAANGVLVDYMGDFQAWAARDMGLLAALANYGVLVRSALVLDRASLNLTMQVQENGARIHSVPYPHWIAVREQGGNPGHRITSRFGGLDMYWASPLELVPPAGVEAEVLFTTTAQAWLQTGDFIAGPDMVSFLEDEEAQTRGTRILGAALSGVFPSAFDFEGPPSGIAAPARPSRLIVVGDANFAGDIMQVSQGEARNLDFLIRAAEWLSSDDDMLDIRGREGAGRLDRIIDVERRAAAMAFSLRVNTVFVPLGVALAGLVLVRRRSAKTRNAPPARGAQR
ncbi:MAG: GldG family protein [Treponema sp.]|nr:GldG family protein [Treponema sp.]